LTWPNRYSTATTIRSRTSSPAMPPVVARKAHGFPITAVERKTAVSAEPRLTRIVDHWREDA